MNANAIIGGTTTLTQKLTTNGGIEINGDKIKSKKFTFNASSNPKDIGPFPEYTLWYNENDELMKFKFKNWKDKKIVTIIRSN